MFQLAAGLTVIAASAALGYLKAEALRRRPEELRDWITALRVLASEISYGLLPLPRALAKAAEYRRGPVAGCLAAAAAEMERSGGRRAGQVLSGAVRQFSGQMSLLKEDLVIIESLGHTLGASGIEEQLKDLSLAIERLSRQEEEAREAYASGGRMWRYLGILGGLTLVLLFY